MTGEETTVAEILRYFFFLESGRKKFHCNQQQILQWRGLSDYEVLRRAIEWLCERDDTNPVLVWTVGDRCGQVSRWVRRRLDLDVFYTCGINPQTKNDLDEVHGNVLRFCEASADKYRESRRDPVPEEVSTLIAVLHRKPHRDGEAELIDGAHRAISMIKNHIAAAECLLAELFPKQGAGEHRC